jgi:hypothetical protein
MENFISRVRIVIENYWHEFINDVGNGRTYINKEASMQLKFAFLLLKNKSEAIINPDESIEIEVEKGIRINSRLRECDIVIELKKGNEQYFIPIEMKCYKTISASGRPRFAHDLFKFGIYEDLELLEGYEKQELFLKGIQLTMTDNRSHVFPKYKRGKGWDYDTSHSTIILPNTFKNTPIGGKDRRLTLLHHYVFEWIQLNNFYFLKLEHI